MNEYLIIFYVSIVAVYSYILYRIPDKNYVQMVVLTIFTALIILCGQKMILADGKVKKSPYVSKKHMDKKEHVAAPSVSKCNAPVIEAYEGYADSYNYLNKNMSKELSKVPKNIKEIVGESLMGPYDGKWDLWYHSLSDNKWTKTSYKNIFKIETLVDYKILIEKLELQHLQNGMYFLMRDDIFPNWEDPDNRCGGCWSYKVPGKNIKKTWDKILLKILTENIITHNEELEDSENVKINSNEINGISISPKKEFNIIKIWNKNSDLSEKLDLSETNKLLEDEGYIYKKHLVD